jgi:hypothetical protein
MTERTNADHEAAGAQVARTSCGTPPVRRPYRAPTLSYLGSVRQLTLGKTRGSHLDLPKASFRPP